MLILDRVEENIAYITMEDGSMCADAALLAPGLKEGDVLIFSNGLYHADEAATAERRAGIRNKLKQLLQHK